MAKSFSIKVGADTSEFLKGMRSANKEINATTRLGNQLNRSLKLEFNPKVAAEAQKSFQKALSLTEEKAKALRDQLKFLESQGQVDTESYVKLQTELAKTESNAIKLKKQLDEVKNAKVDELAGRFEKVGGSIESAGKKLTVLSAAAGGAIAGMTKLAKDAVKTGDDIMTLSDQYDMSTTAIQQWQYVAMQSDLSADTLFKSAQKVQRALGEQLKGNANKATEALDLLGISFQNFDSTETAFAEIINQLSLVDDHLEQVAIANDIFGDKLAVNVIPLLKQGAGAVNEYLSEFAEVGHLSEETVSQLAKLDNEVNKVTAQFNQAKTELGVAMIPIYKALVDILQNSVIPMVEKLAKWFENLSPASQKTILGILGIIAVAGPLIFTIGKMVTGIGGLIKLLGTAKLASLATAAGFAALGGALVLGLNLIGDWKNMSTIEKILKALAVAALVAAAAVTVFHASWSLGATIGVIAAAVVAGVAMIKSAGKDIGVEVGDTNQADIMQTANSSDWLKNAGSTSYYNQSNDNYSSAVDNSTTTNYIEIKVDNSEMADEVARKLAIRLQARR